MPSLAGIKDPGLGRESGRHRQELYTELMSIAIGIGE